MVSDVVASKRWFGERVSTWLHLLHSNSYDEHIHCSESVSRNENGGKQVTLKILSVEILSGQVETLRKRFAKKMFRDVSGYLSFFIPSQMLRVR